MQQTIGNKSVYVVDFDTMPELPIKGLTSEELKYRKLLGPIANSMWNTLHPTYAQALTNAIETGVITEPGKYAIYLVPGTANYEVYTIQE